MNTLICTHCGEYRIIGNLSIDIGMYLAHVVKDHPEVIRQAEEMIKSLSPKFNWRTAMQF